MIKNEKYSGITLLETTIYLGMFAILFAALMQFYFSIGYSNQRAAMQLRNERSAMFLSQHTKKTVRQADYFDEANSTYDIDLSTIRLTYGGGYKEYYVSNSTLYITDGSTTTALTPPEMNVNKFRVDVSQPGSSSMYRLDFEIIFNDPDFPQVTKTLDVFYITQ